MKHQWEHVFMDAYRCEVCEKSIITGIPPHPAENEECPGGKKQKATLRKKRKARKTKQ